MRTVYPKLETLMKFEDNSILSYQIMSISDCIILTYHFKGVYVSEILLNNRTFELLKKNFFNEERIVNMNFSIEVNEITDIDENVIKLPKIQAEEYDNIFALYYIHNGVKHYIFEQENYIKERVYN